MEDNLSNSNTILTCTGTIVTAYVSNNPIPIGALPALIKNVHGALSGLFSPANITQQPAVPIHKSITPDYLICLEDGKQYKMLKRYLRAQYGMTPEAYRAKWNLPSDYPMIAPSYAAWRSEFAKKIRLGHSNLPIKRSLNRSR